MTQPTITLPMETIAKHAVSVGRSSSSCMNCGGKYVHGNICTKCGTALAFAVSEQIGDGVVEEIRHFAAVHNLEMIGYNGGLPLPVKLGGGTIYNEGQYAMA